MSINIKTHNYSINRNTSYGRDSIRYIVLHYTATPNATAANEVAYFGTNPSAVDASADFFVDENEIWQYNTQLDSRYSWAVGVDYSGGTAPYHGKCTNRNSVSIEMSCYLKDNQWWYIKEGAYKNAVELTKYLMNKYNIPISNVIRHYDVCHKDCPGAVGWIKKTGSEAIWNKFKSDISNGKSVAADEQTKVVYRVRKLANDSKSQLGAFVTLENAKALADKNSGYSVFDSSGNLIYSPASKSAGTKDFKVCVSVTGLRIRTGAGLHCQSTGYIKQGVYTIVDTKKADGYTWGKLKSGAGWIALEYAQKV